MEYGDIVKGLPVDYASCKGIYCFHVLEHLSPDNFRIALGNTYKFLQPGGVFRFVLPDLQSNISATPQRRPHPLLCEIPIWDSKVGHVI